MKYTKKQFFADVKAEADAIKANATKQEIEKLNIRLFDPNNKTSCIYGLMTGHCRNVKSVHLIKKCCITTIKQPKNANGHTLKLKQVINNANGPADGNTITKSMIYYSTIEAYILLPEAKNSNLIAYIKGETDKLVL